MKIFPCSQNSSFCSKLLSVTHCRGTSGDAMTINVSFLTLSKLSGSLFNLSLDEGDNKRINWLESGINWVKREWSRQIYRLRRNAGWSDQCMKNESTKKAKRHICSSRRWTWPFTLFSSTEDIFLVLSTTTSSTDGRSRSRRSTCIWKKRCDQRTEKAFTSVNVERRSFFPLRSRHFIHPSFSFFLTGHVRWRVQFDGDGEVEKSTCSDVIHLKRQNRLHLSLPCSRKLTSAVDCYLRSFHRCSNNESK